MITSTHSCVIVGVVKSWPWCETLDFHGHECYSSLDGASSLDRGVWTTVYTCTCRMCASCICRSVLTKCYIYIWFDFLFLQIRKGKTKFTTKQEQLETKLKSNQESTTVK